VVARREFVERVRTVWFVVVTVLGPVGLLALVLVPAWVGARTADEQVVVEVVDRSTSGMVGRLTELAPTLAAHIELRGTAPDVDEEALRARIRSQAIQGYLIVPGDVLDGGEVTYRGDNATNFGFQNKLNGLINAAAIGLRAERAGLSAADALAILRPVAIDAKHTTGSGEAKGAAESFIVGLGVMLILYVGILFYAVNVMRSVLLEKTSRVVEIVVSATRPAALMAGKVLGVGTVGLLQLGIWSTAALLLVHFRGGVLGLFGLADVGGDLIDLSIGDVALILVYFVLGYFFYAAVYAALGAMVNSDQEAQQVQTPVMLLLMAPAMLFQVVANDPRGTAASVITLVPFSAPVLMPMRWVLDGATPLDLAVSLAVMVASIAGVVLLAARIYRVGILMYGKRPTLRELGRWLRQP
jgi:ABC-2 type transport system permease protein